MRAKRCAWTWSALLPVVVGVGVPAPAARAGAPTDRPPSVAPLPAPAPSPGAPVRAVARGWPVGVHPRVVRGWEPPATPYGPGHRGVDLAAAPGDPVRAVGAGRVAFAGRVAGRGVIAVDLAGTGEPPLRTTYEPVRASVRRGEEVAPGEVLGVLEPAAAHCARPCLHWGLRSGETYLDPLSLLPPWLLRAGPSRLLRVEGVPLPRSPGRPTSRPRGAASAGAVGRGALSPGRPEGPSPPPPR
ncbi:peptidoglycan DD-metalloendopeptidase family protein [Streptomyces sp. NPDC007264]|uniref:peptidoglycan DD-metalloendopeptidase family protein n=1 Tax=Streptomyces sp. NPDC007264 TaxID=3364777 RepID=UPI0036DB6202